MKQPLLHRFILVGAKGRYHSVCANCDIEFRNDLPDECPGDSGKHPNRQRYRNEKAQAEVGRWAAEVDGFGLLPYQRTMYDQRCKSKIRV